MAKPRNPHVGGLQLPLIKPDSSWTPPTELPDLRRCPLVALDRETKDDGLTAGRGPGWAFKAGHTVGVSLAWEGGSLYAPTRHPDTANLDPENVRRWEEDHIKAGVRFVYCNANYDIGWGVAEGVPLPEHVEDVMAMAVMDDEYHPSYSLDSICRRLGIEGKDNESLKEAGAAYGYHTVKDIKQNMWRMPARYVAPYATQDAVATLSAFHALLPRLDAQGVLDAYRLEMDIVPMIVEMRRRGISVDTEKAARVRDDLMRQRDEVFKDLSSRLGERVGMEEIGRNKWMERVFTAEGIRFPRTAPTAAHPDGQPSFTAGSTGWMQKHPHWLPTLIVKADKLNNFATKFLQGFIIDYAHRGRIHANINQLLAEDEMGVVRGARTFRFSYSDPALQQMPSRDESLAALIRGCFLAEHGEYWCRCDYSQQEYRLIVHFACLLGCTKAEVAAEKYLTDPDTDYHSMVAELTGLDRKPAKDTNFAKSYGAGIPKFAAMINKSVEEATAIMEQYDREMPFVKELAEQCQKLASQRGWIKLLDGARSHFPEWELAWRPRGEPFSPPARLEAAKAKWKGQRLRRAFTKDGMNRLIQGSAARQTKMAMRACWREKLVPLLQVHDELDFSVGSREDGERAAELMRDVVRLKVPMAVDAEYGRTWGSAKNNWEKRDAT